METVYKKLIMLSLCMLAYVDSRATTAGGNNGNGEPMSSAELAALQTVMGQQVSTVPVFSTPASSLTLEQKLGLIAVWDGLNKAYGDFLKEEVQSPKDSTTVLTSFVKNVNKVLNITKMNDIIPGLGDIVGGKFDTSNAMSYLGKNMDQNISNSLSLVFNNVIPYLDQVVLEKGCGGQPQDQDWCPSYFSAALANWNQAQIHWNQLQGSWIPVSLPVYNK